MPQLLTRKLVDERMRAGRQSEVSDSRQPGLVLRAGFRTSVYQYVWSPSGRKRRLMLGNVDGMSIDDAREVARKAADMVRQGYVPDKNWVREARNPAPVKLDQERNTWTYGAAVEAYLLEIARTRRPATLADYRKSLNHVAFKPLFRRYVADVTEEDVSLLISTVHAQGKETQASGLKRKVAAFWGWLQRRDIRKSSGVSARLVIDLPNRSAGSGKVQRYPHPGEVGLLFKKAQAGELGAASAAVVLLCLTVQRRLTIATAHADHVRSGIWEIPPIHRKTADRRQDNQLHTLPFPVEVVVPDDGYLFPATRPRRAGGKIAHLSESTITHALSDNRTGFSPHDIRRSFTSSMRIRGYTTQQIELILDHNEGDVRTIDTHYDAYRDLPLKEEILGAWKALLEGETTIGFDEWSRQTGVRPKRKGVK